MRTQKVSARFPLWGLTFLVLLLVACQIPLSPAKLQTAEFKTPAPGKASLVVKTRSTSLLYSTSSQIKSGRVMAGPPPEGVVGIAHYRLENGSETLLGLVADGLTDVQPGYWNLTVDIYDPTDTSVIGTGQVSELYLRPGANTVTVTVEPTQNGMGTMSVGFSWPWYMGEVDGLEFTLRKITKESTDPLYYSQTSVPVKLGTDYTFSLAAGTADFQKSLLSGTYRLILQLKKGNLKHPPITATATIYDNITSVGQHSIDPNSLFTRPNPVTDLTYFRDGSYVSLEWGLNYSTAQGFTIYRNGSEIGTVGPSETYFDHNDSVGGLYEVEAWNDFGVNRATPISILGSGESPQEPPSAVAGFSGYNDQDYVTLTWSATDPSTQWLTIYKDGNYLATVSSILSSYQYFDPSGGYYEIEANNEFGSSPKAGVSIGPPALPTSLVIENAEGGIQVDDYRQLMLMGTNSYPGPFVWSSSNPEVLEVDSSGLAHGVSEGLATITVTLEYHPEISTSVEVALYYP